ncbi:hypothetical protein GCM10023149_39700 [Mucilaginibacter gynuensis]|uniref:Glycosyl transferase family 1 domain-containing protein n=1 Tax=Mucilaginibacter gynuensis TaxID=1302236 RepID=A0ABP8H1T2_9SPHI
MKKKILISAYALSPVKGSEFAVAWNTVTKLADHHELWVLYGMSDDHMGDTQTMRQYIIDHPLPSVHFIEVRGSWLANTINLLNKVGLGWFFYFAYYLWQKEALKTAREILKRVDIDVVHQLGPIGFREPGFLWELDKPMVWGPIGGMIFTDERLLQGKALLTRLKFRLKNSINTYQLNSGRIRTAFEKADVLFTSTQSGREIVKEKFDRDSYYLPEVGILKQMPFDRNKFKNIADGNVELVWSGSHIERKNLELCLDALAKVKATNWVLNVLGSGPLTEKLKLKSSQLNIADRIKWHGHLKREEAINVMAQSHLHIITSIAEDNTTVIFEAMSFNVPTLALNHCGMRDVICDSCGIRIDIDDRDMMVNNLAVALNGLLTNPQRLEILAKNTGICADSHSWDKRLVRLENMYNEAISLHNERKRVPEILMA